MNTKTFAQNARTMLMKGVATKLQYWGFDTKGQVSMSPKPVGGGYIFRGDAGDDPTLIPRWESLRVAILRKGFDTVKEEAAYTWFNRIMAIRILAKNDYERPQLEYAAGGQQLPLIVQQARRGHYPFLDAKAQARLKTILSDFSKEQAAFAILLIGYCQQHPLIKRVFGGLDDYTELLLPDDILADGGFIHLLNTTDAISDAEYKEVELIGWLYQFYISERKDEVFKSFKKKQKAEAKDIPAATQIFTPNWIVKYMVENTVGKIWLDKNPDSALREQMKYLVENADNAPLETTPLIKEVTDLKLLDPAVGSGHILVEGFDLLFQIYEEDYFAKEEAVEKILANNLFGLDIDQRAVQLARFAVLLKAAQYYPDVLKKDWLPHIYAMPEARPFTQQEIMDFLGRDGAVIAPVLTESLALMQQAKNLGSIMQFQLGDWDLKNPTVLQFLLEKKWINPTFYDLVAEVIQELEDFAAMVEKEWGSWSFTKAKVLKGIEEKPAVLETIIRQTKAIDQKASQAAIHSGYSLLVNISEILDLPNQAEAAQKENSKWLKRLMDNTKFLHQQLQEILTQLNIPSRDLKGYLAQSGLTQQKIQLAFLEKASKSRLKDAYLLKDLEVYTKEFIFDRWDGLKEKENISFHEGVVLKGISPFLEVLQVLCDKYEAVVANPPYMGRRNMNEIIKNYVEVHYPDSKGDLSNIFIESILKLNSRLGLLGMINQQSWMFLKTYSSLRKNIIDNNIIVSMLHLGAGLFDEIAGEVVQSTSFILKAESNKFYEGIYHRLNDHSDSISKRNAFLSKKFVFNNLKQIDYNKIPGHPIAYWASEETLKLFTEKEKIGDYYDSSNGIQTGKNEIFVRNWFEVSFGLINKKWYFYNKGGTFRKWYGNINNIVNWDNDGEEIRKRKNSCIRGEEYYLKEGVTWSDLTSGKLSVRYLPEGCLFDAAGPSAFITENSPIDIYELICLLNTKYINDLSKMLNPTLHFQSGDFRKLPFDLNLVLPKYKNIGSINILISKKDWDSTETSWDFQKSPLLNNASNLPTAYQIWKRDVTKDFFKLHTNEEELNRIFIDIYGLQEELTPEVALKDITVLQGELDRKQLDFLEKTFRAYPERQPELPIKKGVVMQQFISYAIGIFMGRYRLDKPGLHIAHPNPSAEEITAYDYNGQSVMIDDDAIVPLMGTVGEFSDDALVRFKELLDTVWGAENRTINLNFLQGSLDLEIEKYLVTQFWKDHCKRYKKKPIYWLFRSAKGAFQVLVYMHRMNAFTVEKIRANYLMEHLKQLRTKIAYLAKDTAALSSQEAKDLDKLRQNLLECEQYDMLLKDIADRQIKLDLDEGVTKNYELFEGVVAPIK